jgi:hypothetical protein
MSSKNTEGSNVLPFKRIAKRAAPGPSPATELAELLGVYDPLISLLRETYDEGLDVLTDSLVESVVRCREALAKGVDESTGQEMLKKMKEELRQIPASLRSLLPGIGPRLGESIERKLGIQFAKY